MRSFRTVLAAAALTCFPAFGSAMPVAFTVDPILNVALAGGVGVFDDVSLSGRFTVSPDAVRAARDRGEAFVQVDEFDLQLDLRIEQISQRLLRSILLNHRTGRGVLNTQAVRFTPKNEVVLDTGALPPGTPLLNFDKDTFPEEIGFPNGRRIGDDPNDLLVLQVFAGSVNLGVAAFDNDPFFIDPIFAQFGQVSPNDSFVFARAVSAAPVPLRAGVWGFMGALGLAWALGGPRRRVA